MPANSSGNGSGNGSYGGPTWGVTPSNATNGFAVDLMATPSSGFAPLHAYIQANACSGTWGAATPGGCWFPATNASAPYDLTICAAPGICASLANWSGTGAFSFWHNYTTGGLYNLTATLTNTTGARSTGWLVVQVVAPIFELVVAPSTGSAPLTVNLSGEILGGRAPYSMTICPVPGSCVTNRSVNASGVWTVTYSYARQANYTATANVTDANGVFAASVAAVSVTRGAPMVVHAQRSGPTAQGPLTVAFQTQVSGGSPPYTLQWWFGDGTTGSGVNGGWTSHTYASAGTYHPSLTVRDAAGHSTTESLGDLLLAGGGSSSETGPALGTPTPNGATLGAGLIVLGVTGALGLAWGVRRWARVRTDEASDLVQHLTQDEVDPELLVGYR